MHNIPVSITRQSGMKIKVGIFQVTLFPVPYAQEDLITTYWSMAKGV